MALTRATQKYWRSMLKKVEGGGSSFKTKSYSTTGDQISTSKSLAMKGEYAPIYMVMGMVLVAVSIAAHTAKQQLVHAPSVNITKKKRGSISEADEPDATATSANKYINKSFLRKIAHIQENKATISDSRPDDFATARKHDSLKTAGVNTSGN